MGDITASPWVINGQDIIGDGQVEYICTWSGRPANARLIAAAPDMLEALEAMLGINSDGIETRAGDTGHVDYSDTVKMAKSAINKARGRT